MIISSSPAEETLPEAVMEIAQEGVDDKIRRPAASAIRSAPAGMKMRPGRDFNVSVSRRATRVIPRIKRNIPAAYNAHSIMSGKGISG